MAAKAQAENAQRIAEDLASGDPEALQRVLVAAQEAFAVASNDLAAATTKYDDLKTQLESINAEITFMSAKDIDITTSKGAKDSEKLEKLAINAEKLDIKVTAAKKSVEKLTNVVKNTKAALATAQETIDNQGKSQEQIYAEA